MNDFMVDPQGLNGLYNLLARSSGDAKDAGDYVAKHCSIEFLDVGYLFQLAGPHRVAYGSVTEALARLAELSQGVGTQVNLAQGRYARTDLAASARLDGTYPGAKDAADLRGTLTQPRPDLVPARGTPFADVVEPTARLVPPNYATDIQQYQMNALTDLISPTAWIRQVCVWLFDYDPFEGWAKSISGDWEAYQYAGASWPIAGAAARDIGTNLIVGTADVSTVWRGHAAEAEQEYQLALANAAVALETACREYGHLYWKAADAAIQLFSSVTGALGQLIDILIVINAAAAIGTATIETVVGPIAGYAVVAYYTWQAYELYKEISGFYQTAEIIIRAVAGAVLAIQSGQDMAKLPTLGPYHHPANP